MKNINVQEISIILNNEPVANLKTLFEYLNKYSATFRKTSIQFENYYFDAKQNHRLIFWEKDWRTMDKNADNFNKYKHHLTIGEFLKLDPYNKLKHKNMTIFKKYELPKINRTVTICVTIDKTIVKAGYAVLAPGDKYNKELAEKISFGRAVSDRTNMVEMQCGFGMDKKYVVYAIADDLAKQIDNGKFVIKGIKDSKIIKKLSNNAKELLKNALENE